MKMIDLVQMGAILLENDYFGAQHYQFDTIGATVLSLYDREENSKSILIINTMLWLWNNRNIVIRHSIFLTKSMPEKFKNQ